MIIMYWHEQSSLRDDIYVVFFCHSVRIFVHVSTKNENCFYTATACWEGQGVGFSPRLNKSVGIFLIHKY